MIKIHLHNVRLLRELEDVKSDIRKAFVTVQIVKESMPGVGTYLLSHKRNSEIKGIIGITTLSKGVKRLGFESKEIKNPVYKWLKKITFYPIYVLSLTQPWIKQCIKQPDPKYIVMSKEQLYSTYIYKPIETALQKEKSKIIDRSSS
nr:hypothetical protein [Salinibacillus xinjiangensis]